MHWIKPNGKTLVFFSDFSDLGNVMNLFQACGCMISYRYLRYSLSSVVGTKYYIIDVY